MLWCFVSTCLVRRTRHFNNYLNKSKIEYEPFIILNDDFIILTNKKCKGNIWSISSSWHLNSCWIACYSKIFSLANISFEYILLKYIFLSLKILVTYINTQLWVRLSVRSHCFCKSVCMSIQKCRGSNTAM
jgi:hypothetical protein